MAYNKATTSASQEGETMSVNDSSERKKWAGMAIQLMSLILYPAGVLQMLSYRLIGVKAVYHWGYARPKPLTPVSQIQVFFARVFPAVFLTLLMIGLKFLLKG
jgi:hypothetical protein